MKWTLRIIGFAGFLLFAAVFIATFLSPIHFEQAGKEFIRREVEAQVRNKIEALRHPTLEKAAGLLTKRYDDQIAQIRQQLEEGLPEKIAVILEQIFELKIKGKELESLVRASFEMRISSIKHAQAQLTEFIQGKCLEVIRKLLLDLRIFSGTNAAVFLLLLTVSFAKPSAIGQLAVPSVLLLLSTLVSAYFYLFNQNWFFTIIYNDYVGYGYVIYLSVVFLFLCDIALNRARVTQALLNVISSAMP